MEQFVIEGNVPLSGTVTPSGNKNAALPLLAASLLTDQPLVLHNVPNIRDVQTMCQLLADLGVDIAELEPHTLRLASPAMSARPTWTPTCAGTFALQSCWPDRRWRGWATWNCPRPAATSSGGGGWTHTFSRSKRWARRWRPTTGFACARAS